MALPVGLDLDLLRSFVIIAEEKSFTRAAERVGRTQSAVSLQMQRLETVLGQPVLTRGKGGHVELNKQGQLLLGRAKALLDMNDDLLLSLRPKPVHGTVRLGIPDELSGRFLSRILERFNETAPDVEVEVVCNGSCMLSSQLKNNELDLVILSSGLEPRQWPATKLWQGNLVWVTSDTHNQHLRNPLPLVTSPVECAWRPPWLTACPWRTATERALDHVGRKYQIVSTSLTTSGQMAAVAAGMAVICTLVLDALPQGVRTVRPDEGLPPLPDTSYLLLMAREPKQPMSDMLAEQIRGVFKVSAN